MYCDRRRNGQKPPRTKPSRPKTPDKSFRTKTPRTIEREFVEGDFVRIFCTRPTKKSGGARCVTYMYFWGPGMHIPESHRFQHYINYSYTYSHRHWLTPWKLRIGLLTRGRELLTSLDQTEIALFRTVLDSYALNCLHRTNQLR